MGLASRGGEVAGSSKEELGLLLGKEPPPTLQKLGGRPNQATPSHPDAGEKKEGLRRIGWRLSGGEGAQSDRQRLRLYGEEDSASRPSPHSVREQHSLR